MASNKKYHSQSVTVRVNRTGLLFRGVGLLCALLVLVGVLGLTGVLTTTSMMVGWVVLACMLILLTAALF